MQIQITPEILSGAAGILISLVLTYVPKLNVKWQSLEADYKRLILLVALLVVAGGAVALSCWGVIPYVVCDKGGLIKFGEVFIAALIANQAVYPLSIGVDRVKAKARSASPKA